MLAGQFGSFYLLSYLNMPFTETQVSADREKK
jgi:hypothetical protein